MSIKEESDDDGNVFVKQEEVENGIEGPSVPPEFPQSPEESTETLQATQLEPEASPRKSTHKQARNKRSFRGNINYVNFYNRFVLETLNNHDVTTTDYYNPRSTFKPCVLASDGQVYYGSYSGIPGCLWSELDKERFFRALSLHSIHRIDLIHEFLNGKKSEAEILHYYQTLKHELKRKKFGIRQNKNFNYRFTKGGVKKVIRLPRFRMNLLKYSELPIAYEMSEGFIKLEDEQSELIAMKERSRLHDQSRHFSKPWTDYVETQQVNLFDVDKLQLIVNKIYAQQNVVDSGSRAPRFLPKFEIKSLVFLEELVKNITTKIVLGAIERKMTKPKDDFNITRFDIDESIRGLKFQDAEIFNWNKYWSDVSTRLEIHVEDDITNGRLVPNDEVKRYMSDHVSMTVNRHPWVVKKNPTAIEQFEPVVKPENPFLTQEGQSEDDSDVDIEMHNPDDASQITHIDTLSQAQETPLEEQLDYDEVMEELANLETTTLERSDRVESRSYEHGLITYLGQENPELVSDRLYGAEEAEEIVNMWEQDKNEKSRYVKWYRGKMARKAEVYSKLRDKYLEKVKLRKQMMERGHDSDAIEDSDEFDDFDDFEDLEEEDEFEDLEGSVDSDGQDAQGPPDDTYTEEDTSLLNSNDDSDEVAEEGSDEEESQQDSGSESSETDQEVPEPQTSTLLSTGLINYYNCAFADYSR